MTSVNLKSIAINRSGTLISNGEITLVPEKIIPTGEIEGFFDKESGTFSMSIPNMGELVISGMPSIGSIGHGENGERGGTGNAGNSGEIKEKAPTGDIGDRGKVGERGENGYRGYRGHQGFRGSTGEIGDKGEEGEEGHIPFFIQSEDPGNVPTGTIWAKRILEVEREAVNMSAPKLIIDDVTVHHNDLRVARVRVGNSTSTVIRFLVTPEDDEFVTIEYPIDKSRYGEMDLDNLRFGEYDFIIIIDPAIVDNALIKDGENYTTTLNALIESEGGNDETGITLTILPTERT